MTKFQEALLASIGKGRFLHGSDEVHAARKLEQAGLVVLRDDGYMKGESKFQPAERWWVTQVQKFKIGDQVYARPLNQTSWYHGVIIAKDEIFPNYGWVVRPLQPGLPPRTEPFRVFEITGLEPVSTLISK